MYEGYLPISKQDMIDRGIEQLDFVYVCGDVEKHDLALKPTADGKGHSGKCAPSRKISICWQIVFCGRTIFVWLRKRITFKSQKKVDTAVCI